MSETTPYGSRGRSRALRVRGIALGAMLFCSLVVGACATDNGASEPEKPPELQVVERARGDVHDGIDQGFQTSEDQDSYRVPVRYNVPRCDAPAFEIRVHGRWTRAWLEGPDEVGEQLESLREEPGEAAGENFEISGSFSGEREAETGVSYPVFWTTELEDDS